MYYQKTTERARVMTCVTQLPLSTFFKSVAGREDAGVPTMMSTIGGFQQTFLNGKDLLNFHASYQDSEAEDGPFLFAWTKDGTVAWPTNKAFHELQKILEGSLRDIVFNEDILSTKHIPDNQIIGIGALMFGRPSDRVTSEVHVIVETYYLYCAFN